MQFAAALLIVNVASIFACHFIAKRNGANPVAWGLVGAVLGPIGILLALFSKRSK